LLKKFELPTSLPEGFDTEELLRITRMDKKFESGKIRFVLLPRLGDAVVNSGLTESDLVAALDEIRK
jgi:3-dehydroquinate synthetase